MHMVTARLGCKRTMVSTGWANSHPGYMITLRKCYSHLLGGSFLHKCCACLLMSGHSSGHLVRFWGQSSDRNEGMVHYRHVYAKSMLKVSQVKQI